MLYLHVSNRTENLLRHLAEVLRVSGRRNLFEKEVLLIQSQGMERMISQTLAANFVSWCNFEYFLPVTFLQYTARLLGMEITPDGYDRTTMTWRLEELLRDLEGDEYQPIRRYLQGDNSALKRYQLADRLANIFDQYQLLRPEMLTAWEQNRLVGREPQERWQQSLWRKLLAQQEGAPHRGEVLQRIIRRLQAKDDLSAILPQRVSVFGLSIMPPLFLNCLQGLGRHTDVHLYVLSPCSEYWGDLELHRNRLFASDDGVNAKPQEQDVAFEHHPLLAAFGRQGRDFQRMLFSDQVRFELEFCSYQDPLDGEDETLLRWLQSDLLRGELTPRDEEWDIADRSIQVVSCHSKLREITILREHILRWLYEDPKLELRDIVVMAPDIQEYSALIPAVFEGIQHSISDRSLRRRNCVLAAFVDFLALFQGRFGWDEMLDLLKEPVIAEKLELSRDDLDNLQRWVTGAGIRWGLSGVQRSESGLPGFEEGSWQAGISRLLMGYGVDSEEFVDAILPYAGIEGGAAAALGGLCEFVATVEEARADFAVARSLREWSALLLGYADRLFRGEADGRASGDYLELREILVELGEIPETFHRSVVEFRVIDSWLEHMARETRSSSGFLRGQLTFCSMLPMRSIPFRKVCLIGLGDGDFPRDDRFAAFDLMGMQHRPGDRSRRMDDRYQFLEAILAAREQLYLSYIGQSIRNNEPIPPSVVVSELLEVLEKRYRAGHLLVVHPLHPFSSRYFSGESAGLFSYDDQYCRVAEAIRLPREQGGGWWSGKREAVVEEIDVDDLLLFFRNPQRWFVRNCLEIRLGDDLELVPDSEPFTLNGLENYLLNRELLEGLLAGEDVSVSLEKMQVMARWPLGEPGRIAFAQRVRELEQFALRITAAGMGERCEDLPLELEVCGCRLAGRLGNLHEHGILLCRHGRLDGRELLAGWLHYLLYLRQTGTPMETIVLGLDGISRFKAGCEEVPDLETMVEVYLDGCRQPSSLYIEPGMTWLKKKDREKALGAAREALEHYLEKGFDRETALLLRGCETEAVIGAEFVELTRRVLEPIVRRANGG